MIGIALAILAYTPPAYFPKALLVPIKGMWFHNVCLVIVYNPSAVWSGKFPLGAGSASYKRFALQNDSGYSHCRIASKSAQRKPAE